MKLFSITNIRDFLTASSLKADVVANSNGKSLVILNGVPVQVDTEHSSNNEIAKKLPGNSLYNQPADSGKFSVEKIMIGAGIEKTEANLQIINALKEYGVILNSQNLQTAINVANKLPGFELTRINFAAIAIVLLRKLPEDSASKIRDYLSGKFNFSSLFAKAGKEFVVAARQNWGFVNIFEKLQEAIANKNGFNFSIASPEESVADDFVDSLVFQDLFARYGDKQNENRFYFQWPLFWFNQELPDTLEGEAFYASENNEEQSFSLRMLVNPPALGKMEVAVHKLKDLLWIHFGVKEEIVDTIKEVFQPLTENLLKQDFEKVRLTTGVIRKFENFFLESENDNNNEIGSIGKVDLKI